MPGKPVNAVSDALQDMVARMIISEEIGETSYGHNSQTAVLAYVTSTETEDEPFSMIRIWQYSQGRRKQIVEEDSDVFEKALGNDRSEWPRHTFVFSIKLETSNRMIVDLHTYYDMGIMPDSRGGNAQKWKLEKKSGNWVLTGKKRYMFWD